MSYLQLSIIALIIINAVMFVMGKSSTGILIINILFVIMVGFQLYCMGNPRITRKLYTKEFYDNIPMKINFGIYANISHLLLVVFIFSFNFIE